MSSPRRPTAAYKLLTTLLYYEIAAAPQEGYRAPLIDLVTREGSRPTLRVRSVRRLARLLGTQSDRLRVWLLWLEAQGYLTHLAWSEDRRTVELRIRMPRNIDTLRY